MLQILLADEHEVVRRGLRALLEDHPGWAVCAEARTGREAVALATTLQPDIALVDLTLPELNGIDATRQLRRVAPATAVLIFTMHKAEQQVQAAVRAGAHGYVLKADAATDLVAAVAALAQRRRYFSAWAAQALPAQALAAVGRVDAGPVAVLSGREREILQLLAEGKSNKQVATALLLSGKTVETHRAAIMRKLHATSIIELVRYAVRNGIIGA